MRITVLAIGQSRSGPETELAEDYAARVERLGRTIGITAMNMHTFAEASRKNPAERKALEAERLLDAVDARARTVALSERGKPLASIDFAKWLRGELDNASTEVCFLIGGPDGHDRALEDGASMRLSLGTMTWPHRLARAMLLEQIYRSVTILANHPYHRA